MDERLERKILGLLGLAVRGRLALVGVDKVRAAVKEGEKGSVRVAIVAADVSPNSRDKVDGLLAARNVPTFEVSSAVALGRAVGKESTAIVGVVDAQMAKGIIAAATPAAATEASEDGEGSRRKG